MRSRRSIPRACSSRSSTRSTARSRCCCSWCSSPVILCAALAVRRARPGRRCFASAASAATAGCSTSTSSVRCTSTPTQTELDGDATSALDLLLGGDTAPGGIEGDDRRTPSGGSCAAHRLTSCLSCLNVLRGEMSLIGPVPSAPSSWSCSTRTSFATATVTASSRVSPAGRRSTGSRGQTSLAERVEWDNYYIAHWSLGLN